MSFKIRKRVRLNEVNIIPTDRSGNVITGSNVLYDPTGNLISTQNNNQSPIVNKSTTKSTTKKSSSTKSKTNSKQSKTTDTDKTVDNNNKQQQSTNSNKQSGSIFASETINLINNTNLKNTNNDALNKASSAKERALIILRSGGSDDFPDFKSYGKTFQKVLEYSVNSKGHYYNDNPFLLYAKEVKDTPVAQLPNSATKAFNTIDQLLSDGTLELNNKTEKWLKDTRAYEADDPPYKIKALTLLTSDRAASYGDTDTVGDVISAVLDEKKKVNIGAKMDMWQTKDGEDNRGKAPKTDSELRDAEKKNQEFIKLMGNLPKKQSDLETLFRQNYSVGDTAGEVLDKIQRNMPKK